MPTEIIVAVITGCITLAGVLISNSKSQAVTETRLEELMILLGKLPHGQVKHLLRDETCAAILEKYGITGGN